MRLFTLTAVLLTYYSVCLAQKLPATDIYLTKINKTAAGYSFGTPFRLTHGRTYNNEPSFMSSVYMLFAGSDAKQQTDIYQYNTLSGKVSRITHTNAYKEYSPQVDPLQTAIYCVRVEPDDTTQNLYAYSFKGVPIRKINIGVNGQVGYFCWVDEEHIAMSVIKKINAKNSIENLVLYDVKTHHVTKVAENIGRCIRKIPGANAFSYVQKTDSEWVLYRYDMQTGLHQKILNMLPKTEDYTWTNDQVIWCMYEGHLEEGTKHGLWHVVENFCSTPIEKSYRIEVSPDMQYLAVVVYSDAAKP